MLAQFKDSGGLELKGRLEKFKGVWAVTPKLEKENLNVWYQRGNLKSLHLNLEKLCNDFFW